MKEYKTKNLIIGAGITGLTYANYSNADFLIIEKEKEAGGFCRTIYKKDFVWDYAGHFFHFKTDELKQKFLSNVSSDEFVTKDKKTYIHYKDRLIDYPFQMNIHQLPKQEFIDCLFDLFNKEDKGSYDNFLDMLYGKFGKAIVEKFLKPYNEKLYACDLKKLDEDAMGRFFPYADISAIINNMKASKDLSYNNTFIYPKRGAQIIIDILLKSIDKTKIKFNTTLTSVDLKNKKALLSNGEIINYENLINTMPFNNFIKLLGDNKLSDFSDELTYNKVLVFNLGFNKKSKYTNHHWIYIPDRDINFYRVGFYDNILDTNKLSMYIEIGYSKDADIDVEKQLELTLKNLEKIGIIDNSFILEEYVNLVMDPAYVHINHLNNKEIDLIKEDLKKNNVYSIGRYGAWTYCSMEDSMLQGKDLAKCLN